MTQLAVAALSREEARSLTDEVKHDAERLWRKLVELYDGGAHLALGYSSWGSYFKTEFGGSRSRAYQLLDAGRALEIVQSTTVESVPRNEAQARELAPLLDRPDELRDAWAEASANGEPTALKVREAVQRVLPPITRPLDPDVVEKHQRDTAVDVIDRSLYALEGNPADIPGKVDWILELRDLNGSYGPLTPERFEKAAAYCSAFAHDLRRRSNGQG